MGASSSLRNSQILTATDLKSSHSGSH